MYKRQIEFMINNFGSKRVKNSFNSKSKLVEIGDHSYSHKIVKKIKTRPDKVPANFKEIKEEFQINTNLFQKHLSEDIAKWGFRTPLGHKEGLKCEFKLLDTLKNLKVKYNSP